MHHLLQQASSSAAELICFALLPSKEISPLTVGGVGHDKHWLCLADEETRCLAKACLTYLLTFLSYAFAQ